MPKEKTVNIHVTYNETKRIISFRKGRNVLELKNDFLQKFSDVLPPNVSPKQVKFQRYDKRFQDVVDLDDGYELSKDLKVRAPLMENKQYITLYSGEENNSGGFNGHLKVHTVKINTTYRLWSLVSKINDGILRRNPFQDSVICDGSFNMAQEDDARMEAIDETRPHTDYVAFLFKDTNTNKQFVLTATGKGNQNKSEEVPLGGSISDESLFEPVYFWSYTMFRNCFYSNYYLGCDHTGKTTLVENWDTSYPNPQALFILNKF